MVNRDFISTGGEFESRSTARIVGIAPGHDERVHDLDAFKTILTNATRWVAGT